MKQWKKERLSTDIVIIIIILSLSGMPVIVYAIFDSRQIKNTDSYIDFPQSGSGVELEFISANKLTAIVSVRAANKCGDYQEEVLAYAGIVEKIFTQYSILPMRYGSVLTSYADVIVLLEKNSESISNVLNKIMNKEEYSLRLLFSNQHHSDIFNEKCGDNQHSFPDILQGNTESKKYLLKKYQKHIVDDKRIKYLEKIESIIAQHLKKITEFVDFNKRLTPALIVDAVLLIDRSAKDELLSLVAHIQSIYPEYNVILTGPWPPFNFAQIKLE